MRMKRGFGGTVMLVGWLTSGCGSSGGSGRPIPLEELGAEVTAVDCKKLVECYLVSDEAFCLAYFNAVLPTSGPGALSTTIAAVKAGRIKYDGTAARTCLDQLENATCQNIGGDQIGSVGVCQKVMVGTITDGATCTDDTECVPGSFCTARANFSADSCSGVCIRGGVVCNSDAHCAKGQACDLSVGSNGSPAKGTCVAVTPPGAVNQPCGSRDNCQSGLFCARTAGASVCKPLAKSGEACEFFECVAGLLCVGGRDGGSGICMTPAGKGEACAGSGQCGGSLSSLVCDATTKVCVDAPTSGPCAADTLVSCNVLSAVCDASTNTCRPFTELGAPCNTATLECGLLGSTCQPTTPGSTTGVCTARGICND